MAWTTADFILRYPELGDFPNDHIAAVLADAEDYIPSNDDGPYGRMRYRAVGLLAAHWLTQRIQQMGQNLSQAGRSSGGRAFGQRKDSTVYGQELARLEAGLPVTGFVAGDGYIDYSGESQTTYMPGGY